MKLATLKEGGRDGRLVVVSRDLQRATYAHGIARTLQALLDDWERKWPALRHLATLLNQGAAAGAFEFDQATCHSPLPRAYQWADGSAYLNHAALILQSRGETLAPERYTDPLMYQGGSDSFIGPRDPILAQSEEWGIDLEGEIAVITDDVPMGVSRQVAGRHIKLLMLVNDVSLRNLIPAELSKGFGFFQGKPATAFSPVAVTPDELGEAWDGKIHLPLVIHVNDSLLGAPNAGTDAYFDFAQLIAHAATTRQLAAGTIIGMGTVSNRNRATGSACIMERRVLETIERGAPITPFLKYGDRVRIEMFDAQGRSIFGAIDQTVERYSGASTIPRVQKDK